MTNKKNLKFNINNLSSIVESFFADSVCNQFRGGYSAMDSGGEISYTVNDYNHHQYTPLETTITDPFYSKEWWTWIALPEYTFVEEDNYPVKNVKLMKNGSFIYEIAVTGFKKDELDVAIENNKVVVKGSIHPESTEEEVSMLVNKLAKRDFTYTIDISDRVDIDNIEVSMDLGILKIIVPMKKEFEHINRKLVIK